MAITFDDLPLMGRFPRELHGWRSLAGRWPILKKRHVPCKDSSLQENWREIGMMPTGPEIETPQGPERARRRVAHERLGRFPPWKRPKCRAA